VLLLGPTAGGKTFTLNGKQGNLKGILPRAIDKVLSVTASNSFVGQNDILNYDCSSINGPIINLHTPDYKEEAERVYLRVSVYLVFRDQIHDLLANSP
jgi:hypothetical protein